MLRLRLVAALALIAAVSIETEARATCTPSTAQSTCFDADPLFIPAAPSRFVGIPSAQALPAHRWSVGIDVGFMDHPVTLSTRSSDPNGRDVEVVARVFDADVSAAYSPVRDLEVTAVLPFAITRSGTGLTGITSQAGPSLQGAAFRDFRLGAGYALWSSPLERARTHLALMTRLELTLPTGSSGSFAGDRSPIAAPSLGLEWHVGAFYLGAQDGFRIREPVALGNTTLGTQFISTLGIGVVALDHDRLSFSVEAWLMPPLVSQSRILLDRTRVSGALVPAEWMASLRAHVDALTVILGCGTAIPLSAQTRTTADGAVSTSHFAAATSPDLRATLVLRYEGQ